MPRQHSAVTAGLLYPGKALYYPLMKVGTKNQVFRRISGQCQFGKHDQVSSGCLLFRYGFQNTFTIAFDISDQKIQLGQGDIKCTTHKILLSRDRSHRM